MVLVTGGENRPGLIQAERESGTTLDNKDRNPNVVCGEVATVSNVGN